MRRVSAVTWLWVFLFVWLVADGGTAAIYRWVDGSGTPHFTDRPEEIPPQYRGQLELVEDDPESKGYLSVIRGIGRRGPDPVSPPGDPSPAPAEASEAVDWEQILESQGAPDLDALAGKLAGGALLAVIPAALAAVFVALAIGALMLKLACRIVGEGPPGFAKALAVVGVQSLAGGALGVLGALMLGAAPGLGVQGGQFAGGVLLNAGILRAMHAESFPRALFVTAMVMVLAFVFAFVLMFFVVCAGGTAAVLSGGSGSA